MIGIAINLLWLLIGVVILCAVVYFVLVVLRKMGLDVPERIEQAIYLIILLLVIIAVLTMLAGGGAPHLLWH